MKRYVEDSKVIHKVFTVGPNDVLAAQLERFEAEPVRPEERVLRTFGAKALNLVHDIDRGDYAKGDGAALKRFEHAIGQVPALGKIALQNEVVLDRFNEGAVIRLKLALNASNEHIYLQPPFFTGDEAPEVCYYVPLANLPYDDELEAGLESLKATLASRESRVIRPKIVDPARTKWPKSFSRPVAEVPAVTGDEAA